ncbi:hypothetical protein BDF19DRAFT_9065 [Syncephalis fuscata]|nr:hypothetical protein BDF19DRAFT_9065 [Syncephalis fuscata]
MNVTERFKHTVPQSCQLSPSGVYVANVYQHRVVVRNVETRQLVRQWTSTDQLRELHWSPDSELLMSVTAKTDLVQVWCVDDEKWTASLDEAAAGVSRVAWSADSRHILCFSDLQLRLTIWSLTDKEAFYIKYPKQREKGLSVTKDGCYMALAERKEVKDHIGIYDVNNWTLATTFLVDTLDLEGLQWSPNGQFLAVWDTLLEYKLLIYTLSGQLVKSFIPDWRGLGVRSVAWSPSSQFLAVGGYDQKVHLLNHFTWSVIASFEHPAAIKRNNIATTTTIYRERDNIENILESTSSSNAPIYDIVQPPFIIQSAKSDPDKPNPRLGINLLDFDAAGRFFVTRNDNMSHCLWIWQIDQLAGRALIQQLSPVRTARWHPILPGVLAFCCGNCYVYLWTEEKGCQAIELPSSKFVVNGLRWSPTGRSLLLIDRDMFTVAHLDEQLLLPTPN